MSASNDIRVSATYFRFGRKYHPLECPKNSRITIKPLILTGRDRPWPEEGEPILVAREPDKLKGFTITLDGFKDAPRDGIFEFWTKHWNGDSRDAEWPWIHWTFHDVTWKGDYGTCIVLKRYRPISFDLGKETGFQYAKKVPHLADEVARG